MMSLSEQTSSGGDGAYYQTRFYEPRTRNMPNLTSSPLGGPSSPTPPGHIFSEVELNDAFWTASVNVKMLKDMCVCLASLTPTDDCEYAIVNMQSRSVLFPSARAKRCKSFVHFVETSPDYAPGTWLLCIFDGLLVFCCFVFERERACVLRTSRVLGFFPFCLNLFFFVFERAGTFSKTPGENAFEPTLRVFDPYISTFRGTAGASHLIKFYQEMFFPTELARFVLPFQLRSANINNNNQAAAAAAANLLDENAVLTRMRTIFASQQVFPHLKVSRRAKQDSLALSLYAAVSFSSLYLSGRDQITQSDIVDTVSLLTRMMTLLLHAKLRNAKHRDTARRILEDLLLNNDRIDWLQRIL
jgi:hypothetical protein